MSISPAERVWASLQLRTRAIAIPSDLKTGLPATSKYRGKGKSGRMSVNTKPIRSRRDLEILESGSGAEHEHTQVQWRITGRNRPQHPFVVLAQVKGMKERWDRKKMQRKGKKKRKMAPVWNLNTPQRTKNEKHVYVESNSVWVCSYSTISPSFFWLLWIEVPCGQERILFLSHALFSYTCSPLFYTLIPHTLPSLLAQHWIALSLMSDWWMK